MDETIASQDVYPIEEVPLAELRDHPNNPRIHDEQNVMFLTRSLDRYGQVKPIVVQAAARGFLICAGHGVVQAARRLGWSTIRALVLPANWSPEQVAGYMLADNVSGQDDEEKLLDIWEAQLSAGFDPESFGTTWSDYEALRKQLDVYEADDVKPLPKMVPTQKARTQVAPVLTVDQVAIFEQALRKTGLRNRGQALMAICQAYLKGIWSPSERT